MPVFFFCYVFTCVQMHVHMSVHVTGWIQASSVITDYLVKQHLLLYWSVILFSLVFLASSILESPILDYWAWQKQVLIEHVILILCMDAVLISCGKKFIQQAMNSTHQSTLKLNQIMFKLGCQFIGSGIN